jgi:hypothetical protein
MEDLGDREESSELNVHVVEENKITPAEEKKDESNEDAVEERNEEPQASEEEKVKQEEKEETAEDLEKYKDWPLRDIKEPHDNDVLYGRGGELLLNVAVLVAIESNGIVSITIFVS